MCLFLEFYGSLSKSLSQNDGKQCHITRLCIKTLGFVPDGNWAPVGARPGLPPAQPQGLAMLEMVMGSWWKDGRWGSSLNRYSSR